jgi:CHAT domain
VIDTKSLDRAQSALQSLQEKDLKPQEWRTVAEIVQRIQRALHVGDVDELNDAVSDLLRATSTRPDPSGRGPTVGRLPNGGRPRSTGSPTTTSPAGPRVQVPGELVSAIGEATAAVKATTAEVARIPHIDLDTDVPVKPGQRFTVEVYLDKTPSRPWETAVAFELRDPPADLDDISVWLTATPHFAIDGPATNVIAVRRADDASTRARFALTVVDPVPADPDPPALSARFDYRLRASGSVRREVPIILADKIIGDIQPQEAAAGAAPAASGQPGVVMQTRAAAPDLEVSVAPTSSSDVYKVVIKTGLLGGVEVEDDWHLSDDSATYVSETMASFLAKKAGELSRRRALEGAGMEFFDAAPKKFQDLFWRLVDEGTPPKTMLLISEERSVPWELMIPSRHRADGQYEQLDPLGVTCAIGRWHGEDYVSPGQRIPLHDSLVLAPAYNPPLATASAERDLVLEMFPGKNVPATFDELDEFYAANTASLLHFVCHGRDATLQAMKLLANEELWAHQIRPGGLGAACRKARPLVFLNACEVGRPGAGLAAVGGFAASFIASDAAAVIAPLWAVDDGVAHQVAVTFYQAVKNNPATPFADILRGLRSRAYAANGADSYAAYCFYGDPNASAAQS